MINSVVVLDLCEPSLPDLYPVVRLYDWLGMLAEFDMRGTMHGWMNELVNCWVEGWMVDWLDG